MEAARRVPVCVPFVRVAAVGLIVAIVAVTWSQCAYVYHGRSASVGPKLCLAEQLQQSFAHDHWLHQTTLLGAARLRKMLTVDPSFDVAVLAPADEVRRLVRRLESQCGFSEVQESTPGWTWTLTSKGKVFSLMRFDESADGARLLHREAASPNEVIKKETVVPTKPCKVDAAQFQCPHDQESLLSAIFGERWRTADILSFL